MIGAAVQAAAGLASGIMGGIKGAKARREMNNLLNEQEDKNQAWYNANAYSDYTQRADAQNLMRNLREGLDRQNKRAAGMAVITGGTVEQQAMQKEQTNNIISDTYANLGAAGQQFKDRITDRYLSRGDALTGKRLGMFEAEAASGDALMASGINQIGSAGSSMMGG